MILDWYIAQSYLKIVLNDIQTLCRNSKAWKCEWVILGCFLLSIMIMTWHHFVEQILTSQETTDDIHLGKVCLSKGCVTDVYALFSQSFSSVVSVFVFLISSTEEEGRFFHIHIAKDDYEENVVCGWVVWGGWNVGARHENENEMESEGRMKET